MTFETMEVLMQRLFALVATIGLASAASATTIVVESDKLTYAIGETIADRDRGFGGR